MKCLNYEDQVVIQSSMRADPLFNIKPQRYKTHLSDPFMICTKYCRLHKWNLEALISTTSISKLHTCKKSILLHFERQHFLASNIWNKTPLHHSCKPFGFKSKALPKCLLKLRWWDLIKIHKNIETKKQCNDAQKTKQDPSKMRGGNKGNPNLQISDQIWIRQTH